MHFATHQPSEPLTQYIESIFHFKGFMPDHSIERVVPDGRIYLIFELDDLPRNTFDNQSLKPNAEYRRAWLSGMHKNYISISAHPNSEMFVVQFKPGGLWPFVKQDVSDFNDKVLSAQQIFGEQVLVLREQLKAASDDDSQQFQLAQAFLNKLADFRQQPGDILVSQLVSAIQSNSASQLQDIVNASGYSQKQAIQLFKQRVGLNPKSFQRIVRFNEILPLVQKKQSIAWETICADCYYYDQSHFIREFKAFCGYSPKDFLKEQSTHTEANFFPLDKVENQ